MKIRWTTGAVADLENISDYIVEDNNEAALKTVRTIRRTARDCTNQLRTNAATASLTAWN